MQQSPEPQSRQEEISTPATGHQPTLQFKAKTHLANASGGADLHDQGSTAKLYNLEVAKGKRGRGEGQSLVQDAISAARAQGKQKLTLDSEDNGSGKLDGWYKKQGFKAVGKSGSMTAFEMDLGGTPLGGNTMQRKTKAHNPEVRGSEAEGSPTSHPPRDGSNKTGLPDGLKAKMEGTFGTRLDHIRVNKNSSFPAKVGAIATTQGHRIDFAPGQYNPHSAQGQKLIGHEAWHTVQQAQGRVKPTLQMKTGHLVNDSEKLEAEADRMGERVAFTKESGHLIFGLLPPDSSIRWPIQRAIKRKRTTALDDDDDIAYTNPDDGKKTGKVDVESTIMEDEDVKTTHPPTRSKQQIAWEKRKDKLAQGIEAANQKIGKSESELNAFFEAFIDVPANVRVKINHLAIATNVKLDRASTRLSNFSSSVLAYTRRQKGPTPEIQTAIVNGSQSRTILISGNDEKSNMLIRPEQNNPTLDSFYKNIIRPDHLYRKGSLIHGEFLKMKGKIGFNNKILERKLHGIPIHQWHYDKNKNIFSIPNVNIPPGEYYEYDPFVEIIKSFAIEILHKKTKLNPQNKQMRSARAFVKESKEDLPLQVPQNKDNIHAESSILKTTQKAKDTILAIKGTKVACVACQAVFAEMESRQLLGPETSYAWLSKASLTQLDVELGNVEEYLIKIRNLLQSHEDELRFYPVSSGTIKPQHKTYDEDLSDSEDEDAQFDAHLDDDIHFYIEGLVKHVFNVGS